MNIGITGQSGFIGKNLVNYFNTLDGFSIIGFSRDYFLSHSALRKFVAQCDAVIHLAAISRHEDNELLYRTNIALVAELIAAMEAEKATPHVLFASTTHEARGNTYHRSKRDGRKMLDEWARRNHAASTGLLIPNCFGPYGRPHYNSFIATFCYLLAHGEQPQITLDAAVELIYIDRLCAIIAGLLTSEKVQNPCVIPYSYNRKVSEVLAILQSFKQQEPPAPQDDFEAALHTTFKSYSQ